eukprot:bmy_05844T0
MEERTPLGKFQCQNLFSHEGGSSSENAGMNSDRCFFCQREKSSIGDRSSATEQSLKRKCCLMTGIKPFKEFFKEKPKLCH